MNNGNTSKYGGIGLIVLAVIAVILLRAFRGVISTVIAILIGLVVIVLVVFGVTVIISALKGHDDYGGKPKTSFNSIMAGGRMAIGQLKVINPSLKNAELRAASEKFTAVAESVLSRINGKPDEILNAMQFTDRYLPEIAGIIKRYKNTETEENTELGAKLASYINQMSDAVDAKYGSLAAISSAAGLDEDLETLLQSFMQDDIFKNTDDIRMSELEKKYEGS